MLSLLSEIRFWSTQDDIVIKSTDYSCYKYNVKKDPPDSISKNCKRNYAEKRGLKYIILNKRPEKLKDKLRELEDALLVNKIVYQTWNGDLLQLMLSRGLIISLKIHFNDITSINFDKSLIGRIQTEVISDGIINGNQVVCVCKDGRVFGYGGLWKDWMIESGLRRNLSIHGELMVVWGKIGTEHPQPWSPLAKDHQRANLHLYWVGVRGPDLLSYKKTDGEPIKVEVSRINARSVIVVEQKVSQRGAVSIEVCLLELIGNVLKRSSVTSVPLQTQVSCSSLSHTETYLILGCIDGSLAILDRNRGSSKIIKASFIPTHVTWHVNEAVAAISNEQGQIQYYDVALNCINSQLISEEQSINILDISSYFNAQQTVESLFWGPEQLLVALDQGPLVVLAHCKNSLNFLALVQIYLQGNKVDKAIRLLLSWEFNEQAFSALQRIVAHVMRVPLNETTAKSLQDALGSFHCPPVPLSTEVRHKFGPQVKSLTRRFFHQLMRTKMYETAFLLAVDLGHHDLFMDLHYIAVKIGETEMAAAARAQASALLSRCSSEASNCSRSSCSQCSDSSSDTSEESEKEDNPLISNDNYLSTNFNNPIPKTYKPAYVPPIPNIDLPKIRLTNKTVTAPPLPLTPPLPISSINSIGIPLVSRTVPAPPLIRPINPFNQFRNNYLNETRFIPIRTVTPPPRIGPRIPLRLAPPLPVAPPAIPPPLTTNPIKKPQPKVKFSDTVTAFIVPEVKRPVRVPPPAHVTDPQKELADSLPLCHPNEDYLKDFTPIRRESNESPPVQQPKIKVVHFGVV